MSDNDNPDSFKSLGTLKIFDMVRQHTDTLNSLRRLGLNQYEAQAYLALCLASHSTAGELAENAELPRPRVYDVLEKLQQKGFVALKPGRPVRYAALPIAESLKTLKHQKQASLAEELKDIDTIGLTLSQKLKTESASEKYEVETNIWTLKGREAIYSKLASMVDDASDRVIVSSNPAGIASKLKEHRKSFEGARKRGVSVSFVSPLADNPELSGELAKIGGKLFSKQMPTRMVLADDQALMFLTHHSVPPEEEVGLWIRSPHLVQTLEQSLNLKK
jgi:sugar-specific transcriptional regulator TrmB